MKDYQTNELISVIMPVYNRKQTILRAVKSVLNQTYTYLELIIVDDGSTDGSIELVKSSHSDVRIRFLSHEKNEGQSKARNTGAEHARGIYIAFQDSDDEWLPEKLERQMQCLHDTCADMIYCRYFRFKDNQKTIVPSANLNECDLTGNPLKELLKKGNVIGTPTILIKKNAFEQLRGFDASLTQLEDYDLAVGVASHYKVGFIDECLVNVYCTENSVTYRGEEENNLAKINAKHDGYLDMSSFAIACYDRGKTERQSDAFLDGLQKLNLNEQEQMVLVDHIDKKNKLARKILQKQMFGMLNAVTGEDFLVYGTGAYANRLCGILDERGIRPLFFVETNQSKDVFHECRVIRLSDYCREYTERDIKIIVATSDSYWEEIEDNLSSNGFSSIFFYVE